MYLVVGLLMKWPRPPANFGFAMEMMIFAISMMSVMLGMMSFVMVLWGPYWQMIDWIRWSGVMMLVLVVFVSMMWLVVRNMGILMFMFMFVSVMA